MKVKFIQFLSASTLLLSSFANAGLISNSDVASITVSEPENYTWLNESALFNGITANVAVGTERFRALGSAGPTISSSNPFVIDVGLNSAVTVTELSIFHDWGNDLSQQIKNMTVSLFSSTSLVANFNFSYLVRNTFEEIKLISGISVENVDQIRYSVTKTQSANFEIRELVVKTADNSPVTAISAPAMGILAGLMAGLVLVRRKFK